jgi:hypothetical protein
MKSPIFWQFSAITGWSKKEPEFWSDKAHGMSAAIEGNAEKGGTMAGWIIGLGNCHEGAGLGGRE